MFGARSCNFAAAKGRHSVSVLTPVVRQQAQSVRYLTEMIFVCLGLDPVTLQPHLDFRERQAAFQRTLACRGPTKIFYQLLVDSKAVDELGFGARKRLKTRVGNLL